MKDHPAGVSAYRMYRRCNNRGGFLEYLTVLPAILTRVVEKIYTANWLSALNVRGR